MEWTERFFDGDDYRRHYREQVGDVERTGREVAFLREALALRPADRVLDLCCGSGRHAVALAPHVAGVTGFDRTEAFLQQARERAGAAQADNVTLVAGDVRALPFDAEFDAAYNYFTSWGYFGDEDNRRVLQQVRRALKPGGRFLLETQNLCATLRNFRPRTWERLADGTVVVQSTRYDIRTGRLHSEWTYLRDGRESTYDVVVFVPSPSELCRLFESVGFVDVTPMRAPEGGDVELDSVRVAVLGHRPA